VPAGAWAVDVPFADLSYAWTLRSDRLHNAYPLLLFRQEVKELKRSVEALEKKVSKTDCTTVEQKRTDYKVGNSSVPETRGGGGGRGGLGDAFAATRPEIVAESAGAHELQNDLPMGAEASVVMAKRSSFSRNTPGKQLSSTLAGLNSNASFSCLLPSFPWSAPGSTCS
jgi:hypothetical protein